MLTVAIATDIPGEPGRVAPIVSKSCEAVVGDGRCPLALGLAGSSIVTWYAIVRADDAEPSRLTIEFHDRVATGAIVETRDLAFSDRDNPSSRWASAGAVIAAFVAARDMPGGTPPVAPRHSEPPPEPLTEKGRLRWGFDLAMVSGPGLDRGAYRLGGLGRGFLGLPHLPHVIGAMSFRYAQRPGDLDIAWASGSVGLGVRSGNEQSPVSIELLGELVLERMFVTGRNTATGQEASSAQNRFGGRLDVNVAFGVWRSIAVVLGAEANALRPSVDITFLDARAGRAPIVELAFSGGVRVSR
jgi:hypothetical protein